MSVSSLQGVRGLLTLSSEKKEDGLTTPKHTEEREPSFSSGAANAELSAAGEAESATGGAVRGSGPAEIDNPNRHLGLAYAQTEIVFAQPTSVLSTLESVDPSLPDPSLQAVSGTSSTAEELLARQTANLAHAVDSTITDTQKWRAEQAAKLQQELREMNRAHRLELQAQRQAEVDADLALFEDGAGDAAGTPKNNPESDPTSALEAHSTSSETNAETAQLQLELQRLRRRAQLLRNDADNYTVPTSMGTGGVERLLNKEATGVEENLMSGDQLVSKQGKVFSGSTEDRMDRLDIVNKLAALEIATADDEQVKQRQNAAYEDAVAEIDKANEMGDVQGKLESYGDALGDILARLSALDSSATNGS